MNKHRFASLKQLLVNRGSEETLGYQNSYVTNKSNTNLTRIYHNDNILGISLIIDMLKSIKSSKKIKLIYTLDPFFISITYFLQRLELALFCATELG